MEEPLNQLLEKKDQLGRIGGALKQRRKELNLTLRDAENATSIRVTFLQAIEEGEPHKLISPVYAQGFIKHYATYLGEDGDKIIIENKDLFSQTFEQDFTYGIGTLEKRSQSRYNVNGFFQRWWLVSSGVMLALAWYLAKYFELI